MPGLSVPARRSVCTDRSLTKRPGELASSDAGHERSRSKRQPEICRQHRHRAVESRRSDTHNRERVAVHRDRAAEDVRRQSTLLPVRIAHDGNRRGAVGPFFVECEGASGGQVNAQRGKVVRRHHACPHAPRESAFGETGIDRCLGDQAVEDVVLSPNIHVLRIGEGAIAIRARPVSRIKPDELAAQPATVQRPQQQRRSRG